MIHTLSTIMGLTPAAAHALLYMASIFGGLFICLMLLGCILAARGDV